MEVTIFIAFVTLQGAFHTIGERWQHVAWVQKLSQHHYVIWLFHPAVLHGVQDYAVHFVVYSGKVIGAH